MVEEYFSQAMHGSPLAWLFDLPAEQGGPPKMESLWKKES